MAQSLAKAQSFDRLARTRERILLAAQSLFNARGFQEVSIQDVMSKAGLTHGGFYRHFASKGELYEEVVRICYDFEHATAAGVLDAYLSRRHFESRERGCPLIALPSDVARADPAVKRAFERVLRSMAACFERELAGPARAERSLAIASLCVGAMSIARAVADPALSDALRESARRSALELGGWSASAQRRPKERGRKLARQPAT